MVDHGLTQGMTEWVVGHVLRYHLGMDAHIHGRRDHGPEPADAVDTGFQHIVVVDWYTTIEGEDLIADIPLDRQLVVGDGVEDGLALIEQLAGYYVPVVLMVAGLVWFFTSKSAAKDEAAMQAAPTMKEGTYRQSTEELMAFKQFSMCINCMLCYSACPVVSNEPDFLGPAAIALGHRYNMDTRDDGQAERNEIFRDEGTVFSCSYANECSEVCPKNVDPAAAVNQAKFNAVIDWAKGLVLPRGGAN